MRADMAKVLVERPRHGGQYHRKGRPLAVELLPTKEGMRRRWTDRKELNENLAPLRRFLASRVGRHWDSVYAELSAHLAPRNAVQQHVRVHLSNFVALHLIVAADGSLVDPGWRIVGWRHGYDFYVDPRNGVLKRSLSDKTRRREAQQQRQREAHCRAEAEVRVLGPMRELHRIRGIWYEVDFFPFPSRQGGVPSTSACRASQGASHNAVYDVLQRVWVLTGKRYAVSKRQLTTHELRQHHLSNQPS